MASPDRPIAVLLDEQKVGIRGEFTLVTADRREWPAKHNPITPV